MEKGYWHGNEAVIIDEFDGDLTILVGAFTDDEAARIAQGFMEDNPYTEAEYGDYIVYCTQDEWDEQNQ